MLSHTQLFCNPMNYSPPSSSVHVISQARILEWVAIPSPRDLPNPGIESTICIGRQILTSLLLKYNSGTAKWKRHIDKVQGRRGTKVSPSQHFHEFTNLEILPNLIVHMFLWSFHYLNNWLNLWPVVIELNFWLLYLLEVGELRLRVLIL